MPSLLSFCLLAIPALVGFQDAAKPREQKEQKEQKEKKEKKEAQKVVMVTMRHAKADDLAKSLQKAFGTSVTIQPITGSSVSGMLVSGPPESVETALALLAQLDQPAKAIALELIIVEAISPVTLSTESLEKWKLDLGVLQKEGKSVSVRQIDLNLLENKQTKITLGENRPFSTGGNVSRNGIAQRSYTYSSLGTTVTARANLEKAGLLLVELAIEDSRSVPAAPVGGERPEELPPPSMGQLRMDTSVQIAQGRVVLVQGIQDQASNHQRNIRVYLRAK